MSASAVPLTPAELERSLRWNIIAGSFGMVYMTAALGMPLPLYMEAIGATGVQLGVLAGAWQFAMLAQIGSALSSEVFPRRRPIWASVSVVHRLLWAAPCVVPLLWPGHPTWWAIGVIAALALSNLLGQAGTALWQSWMADLVPPPRAGHFWGVRQRVLSLAMAVSALVFGYLLDHFTTPAHPLLGFSLVFTLAALFGVADILLHCTVHEPLPSIPSSRRPFARRLAAPLEQPGFLRFTVAIGIWTASVAMLGYNQGMPGFFAMVNLKENFGASYSQAALVFVATGLGAALWTPTIGRAIDRWGGRAVMIALMLGGPVLMLSWLGASGVRWSLPGLQAVLPQAVVWMSGFSLLLGGIYASAWVCQVRLIQSLTLPAGRVVAMGLHWSVVGLIGSLGPLAAGWVKDHFHHQAALFAWWPGNYYTLLVLAHLLLTWGLALPLVWGLARPAPASASVS